MRRITPDMEPEVARRIAREEYGDLQARQMLINLAEAAYDAHEPVAASLIHAEVYLKDRDEYTRHPWPKGMIRLPIGIPRKVVNQ